jgi:cytochrome c oxidase cbb3-type subunit III
LKPGAVHHCIGALVSAFGKWSAASALLLLSIQPALANSEQEQVERGRTQFGQSCSFCHGAAATGGAEGPSLVRSSLVRHDNNGDLIAAVIREGRPGKGMPSISLAGSQIADVVAFVHAQVAASDRTSAGRPSHDYFLKRLLTGNADAGKKYFYGAGGCASCHSPTGDLAGIAGKYAPVDLQSRFLYPEGKPSTATVTLRSGKKIKGELIAMDGFNVAIRDADGWPHSWPRSEVKVKVQNPIAAHVELLSKYTQADVHNLFAYLETLK